MPHEIRMRSFCTIAISIWMCCSHRMGTFSIDQSHVLHRCHPKAICVDSSYDANGCHESKGPMNESISYFASSCTSCACVLLDGLYASTQQRQLLVLGLTEQFNSISAPVMAWLHHITCSGPESGLETRVHILTSPPKRKMQVDGRWHYTNEWVHKGRKRLQPCNTVLHIDANEVKAKYSQLRFNLLSRVGKIAKLRDVLRDIGFKQYISNASSTFHPSVVAVVDLDMIELPVLPALLDGIDRVTDLQSPNDKDAVKRKLSSLDALCANGRDSTNVQRRFYYDIFATVLLPNTFVFPLDKRKFPKLFPDEDETRVVHTPKQGEDVFKMFTREDLTVLFNGGPCVHPVRSCFGGITLYNADAYFFSQCQYTVEPKAGRIGSSEYNPDDRYSSASDDSTEADAYTHLCTDLKQLSKSCSSPREFHS